MPAASLHLSNPLGVCYRRILLPVADDWARNAAVLRDRTSGKLYPLQHVPAGPWAGSLQEDAETVFTVLDLSPGESLLLEPAPESSPVASAFRCEEEEETLVLHNANLCVRIPASSSRSALPPPGPIMGAGFDGRMLPAGSAFGGNEPPSSVATAMESDGPCCLQWRSTYFWPDQTTAVFTFRWAAGSDTILVAEHGDADHDAAWVWHPTGSSPALALGGGGGERPGSMIPVESDFSTSDPGGYPLHHLGHISYFNQWNKAWTGFRRRPDPAENAPAAMDPLLGVFTGWGGQWQRRGAMRIQLWNDPARGASLHFPMRRGKRMWGLVLHPCADEAIGSATRRCLLNRRKTALADLRIDKTLQWQLTPPDPVDSPRLLRAEDVRTYRNRLCSNPEMRDALAGYLQRAEPRHPGYLSACLALNDPVGIGRGVAAVLELIDRQAERMAEGGYEAVNIFDGRWAKRMAYDLDLLFAEVQIPEAPARMIGEALLKLGHIFSDPDYCRYDDFFSEPGEEEGIAEALASELGDSPVPPNFCAEFFTTFGVVAELYDTHARREEWRKQADELLGRFLSKWFEPDGTYLESLNYHNHIFNEILMLLFPWWHRGIRDWFADPVVRGSFGHFMEMQTPILAHGLDPRDGPCVMDPHQAGRIRSVLGRPEARRAALSANGNSGGDGKEFDHRGELSVGTAIYLDTDPLFSRSLLDAWQRAGCPVLDNEHPALTLTTLPPTGTGEPAAIRRSVHRRSLGLVSRSETLWCLFRAGRATHHMDFDQGHIHLISRDRVLLGDYGYHSMDSEGRPLATPATYLHNTIVYGDDRHATSGYTGLEQAPEPALVHLGDTFDWCVHRILNTNARRLNQHPYNFLSPAPVTLHIRHYLFVKTGWVLLWDVFEESSLPNTFWLHPTAPLREIGAGEFLSEHPDGCGLFVKFLQPMPVQVIENRPLGPLHSFAVRNEPGLPFLSLLLPCASKERPTVKWNPDAGEVTVAGGMFQDRIILPPPDSTTLPKVTGMFPPALQDVTHLQKKG